ncbi:unnamed protein product [Phytomonas sp. EM1]|nr:unnamed protein product [Phytomonas sp. EM1]|eukprot:CCW60917.1 unnamed protein product [Phytomonas sp. isolate EM1]
MGLIAVEAQLISIAQRHLQLRFKKVQSRRGDGWVQFFFPALDDPNQLQYEVQQLCCSLVRDETGGSTTIRLSGETKDSNFSSIADASTPFVNFLSMSGDVSEQPCILDDLTDTTSASSAICRMLDVLYQDIVGDIPQGVHAVRDFPPFLCPTGSRFDVLLKKMVCIRAFSATTHDLASLSGVGESDLTGQNRLVDTNHTDLVSNQNVANESEIYMDNSILKDTLSMVTLPSGLVGMIWIDTSAFAQALALSAHSAGIESELPALWRSKTFGLLEGHEVIQQVYIAVKNYWCAQPPSHRTERTKINALTLLSIASADLREYLKTQISLSAADWRGPWLIDRTDLRAALELCKEWKRMVERLLKKDWDNWDGGFFHDESLNKLLRRLVQAVRIREELEQAAQVWDSKGLPDCVLPQTLFENVDLMDLRQDDTQWDACVASYDREMGFIEPKLCNKIRTLFPSQSTSTGIGNQVRWLAQFDALLRRSFIYKSFEKSISEVAQRFTQHIGRVQSRWNDDLSRATTDLQKLRVIRNFETECCRVADQAYELFNCGVGTASHQQTIIELCRAAMVAIRDEEKAAIAHWRDELEVMTEKIVKIDDAVTIEMAYGASDAPDEGFTAQNRYYLRCLVHPLVRQLLFEAATFQFYAVRASSPTTTALPTPMKLSDGTCNIIQAAVQLNIAAMQMQQSAANFNTVLQQMIPSTRAILRPFIQRTLSHVLFADSQRRLIPFVNHHELEGLSLSFQNSTENLSKDNCHIRCFHSKFMSQVMALQNVDLITHMSQWRSAVDGMRASFDEFLSQHYYKNYDAWRRHWDCQIYKSLEFQYRLGLEKLHEAMDEFKVELVFKQGLVQFKPSFEAIREAYYIKLREFVGVPLRFRGLQQKREGRGDRYEIYPAIPIQNYSQIVTVHVKAMEVFTRLNRIRRAFRVYVVLGLCGMNGAPDLDTVVEQWCVKRHNPDGGGDPTCTGESTRRSSFLEGIQALKEYRAKLAKVDSTMKVDCFTISTIPVKVSIDGQLHRLEESLLNFLRKGIQTSLKGIDEFVFSASNVIERQPTTMDEVGQANKAYREYLAQLPGFEAMLRETEEENKVLRQYSGASIDFSATKTRWEHLREAMVSHTKVIESSVLKMRVSLDALIQRFLKSVQRFSVNWGRQKTALLRAFKERKMDSIGKLIGDFKDQIKDFEDLKVQAAELKAKCEYFNLPQPNFTQLAQSEKDVNRTSTAWSLYDQFEAKLDCLRSEDWLTFRSNTYHFDDFCTEWNKTIDAHLRGNANDDNTIAEYLQALLADWKSLIPLLKVARGDGWMAEHWNQMFRLLDIPRNITSTSLTFGDLLSRYKVILEKESELKQLHARALGEIQLREALQDLQTWALEATFKLIMPTNLCTKVKLITEWKEVMMEVSDNQALVSSLKDSPFFSHFADNVNAWESKLSSLSDSLALLNKIQRKWAYLEPIFARGALPQEQSRFKRVDKEFVAILRDVEADPRIMNVATQTDLNDRLKIILEQIERCQKSLMEYLEAKRDKIPRFYFISDEDLLEILGDSHNPFVIQAHLKKLFMGINLVEFNMDKTAITHMLSADGERVELQQPVSIADSTDAEDWLVGLDEMMKRTLHEQLVRCVEEGANLAILEVIQRFPSQVLQVAQQIHFARVVERAIEADTLKKLEAWQHEELERLIVMSVEVGSGGDSESRGVAQLKIKALILDAIKNLQILEQLIAKNVRKANSWHWQKQLRYSMNTKQQCWVHMADTTFEYTFEYQGNAPKLVHTPLTDKCYLVLTKGMNLGYGGNPYGPAGTGKTESVKALGSAMGRQVLVFNCDEGIDCKAMGRILVGIVKCGAWGCFDEFNRLKIDQLSAISQMIQGIQETLKNKEPTCLLSGRHVEVNPHVGIFVTLNPAGKGYGGRTKLPDNLKQLFREVAMSVPDSRLIASTILLSDGFKQAQLIAKNVVELYKLCGQLLSWQQHYDWGLRPLKAVLQYGGTLMQRWRKERPQQIPTEAEELELIVQSININTLSKLTLQDTGLFNRLMKDVFTGVTSREATHMELEKAILAATAALGLQPNASQAIKALQLYEAMNQRMGVVLVGSSGTGKSTVLRILTKTMEKMDIPVLVHHINPKAMARRQLLGYMDADTREWYDGVLTVAARDVAKQPKEVRAWVVCDGDIDPLWIESLNSVLDDNRLLTMPNGVRVHFGTNVNFLFETDSLKCASPATVSRMGVLFFSEKDIDLGGFLKSAISKQPGNTRQRLLPLLNKYATRAIEEVMRLDDLIVPTTPVGLLNAVLNHVLDAQNEADFIYSMIRALCSAMNASGAVQLANWLYAESGQKPLSTSRPLDTYWDSTSGTSMEFHADLSFNNSALSPSSALECLISGDGLVVQTIEMHRAQTILNPLLRGQACKPIFLVGPEGCGKGCILKHCLRSYTGIRTMTINCSAQTTSAVLIQKLEQLCSMHGTVKGRVLQPKDGERLVIILKNIDLPKPDKYGTVELHAFLQQLISNDGFYSNELEWIGTRQLQLVATMSSNRAFSGYTVTPRLLAMVNIVSIGYPSKKSLLQIYGSYWSVCLRATNIGQGSDYNDGYDLAQLVTNIYERICSWAEGKDYAHIRFSPRHLTRWVANVLMYKIDSSTTLPAVIAYEARRIFIDPLPSLEDRMTADRILSERLAMIGYSTPAKEDSFAFMYVTWFSQRAAVAPEAGEPEIDGEGIALKQQSLSRMNRLLERYSYKDIAGEVSAALLRYGREFKDLMMTVIPPVVYWIACVDRVLSRTAGHLIVVGRPGVGRRDTIVLASYLQQMEVVTFHITQDYTIKNFRADMRAFIQNTVVQNTRMTLIVEEHQIIDEFFLELLNSLVSSGEVPGLFTTEEMEIMYTSLREDAASDGYIGPIASYFVDRLQRNLHVAFILDPCHELFLLRLQSNPDFIRACELLWMGTWSADITKTMCKTQMKDQIALLDEDPAQKGFCLHREMLSIHESVPNATPKDFEVFMKTYTKIMLSRRKSSHDNIIRLEAGLVKLRDAEDKVAGIKRDVSAKKSAVEAMQKEADEALNQIQKNIQSSQEQRDQASELREKLSEEQKSIEFNRKKSEEKLGNIKPLMEAARDAVSSIRTEQLNEMRSLKAPPEPIRDVLEGVLALLGVSDVSWQSMRNFLAERGVKERIVDFDIKNVTPQIRANVSSLLKQKATSFKPEVIHRASLAAAPMADWVRAMVEYSKIMDQISPLTRQIEVLEQNQREGEQKLQHLEEKLKKIDKCVGQLRENFSKKCKEAERLREKLKTAEGELERAEELLEKLSDEKTRWAQDIASLRMATESMPKRALISAAFMTYIPHTIEEVRQRYLRQWAERLGLMSSNEEGETAAVDVRCIDFLRTESEILQYKSEGLPDDELSLENAVAILEATQTPLVIDPANAALEWMKTHLRRSNVIVEVASMHDKRFTHTLELAIRFGKTLLVTEVNTVVPILYPILRRDLASCGAKRIVRVGNKAVDWQDSFRIILFSRSTDLHLPPCAAALVMEVNFSVTTRSLESQLLSITLQNERPELEAQKVELLKKEEGLKMELIKLESQLLRELTDSQGNFMENTQLVTSLNTVKAQASVIQQALSESCALQAELDDKREIYRSFASKGSQIFFLLKRLERLSRMYQFGLNDFLGLFSETLQKDRMKGDMGVEETNTPIRTSTLVHSLARCVFYRVCTGLLKKDRLVFGLQLLQVLLPEQFPAKQWEALVGSAPKVVREESLSLPKWASSAAKPRFSALLSSSVGHELVSKWHLHDGAGWSRWMASVQPELFNEIEQPSEKVLSVVEKLLLISTFRPDRFSALGMRVIMKELCVSSLVPPTSMEETILCSSSARVPVLLVTSSGADPSLEVQSIAIRRMGRERFTQIALGGGVTEEAMQQLRSSAAQGGWIFLKNLHLVLDWVPTLENELCAMPEPHKDFRLIITTEPHDAFPSVLLQMSLKITIEAPPGVKQNLLRTYQIWDRVFLEEQSTPKAQVFFALAWLHAVVQERRTFVPQGWTSYYEFSTADLKAATDILLQLDIQRETNWESLKGFLMDCVYGGRLDNPHDIEVLHQLIQLLFSNEVVVQCKSSLYEDMTVPNTNNHDAVVSLLARKLPNVDQPALLKLPDNADRVVEENKALVYIEQLQMLNQLVFLSDVATNAESRKLSLSRLKLLITPVLELWETSELSKGAQSKLVVGDIDAQSQDLNPMDVFFASELSLLKRLIVDLGSYFKDLHAMVEGTLSLPDTQQEEILEIGSCRMPSRWLDRMGGPRDVKLWLDVVLRRYRSVQTLQKGSLSMGMPYNLADLPRPQAFLNALRQYTASKCRIPLADLSLFGTLASNAGVTGSLPFSIQLKGSSINLQGALMDQSIRLQPVNSNSASSVMLPCDLVIGWTTEGQMRDRLKGHVQVPLYAAPDRQLFLLSISIPHSAESDALKVSLNGVACFLASV